MNNIFRLADKTSHRESSWDKSGKNEDFIHIGKHETKILAELEGPGIIRHIYFGIFIQNPLDFRSAIIRMYWDNEEFPSVEVPLGDFFGVSNCRVRELNSLMITINRGVWGTYGFNIYFPMPFSKYAKIEVENQGSKMLGGLQRAFYYQIDYEKLKKPFSNDIGYFHAFWNREKITNISENVPERKRNAQLWNGKNLNGKDNYVILDTEGDGQLAGLLLCIDNLAGGWYGEGDDMIFIDDDEWPPSIHGTGSEEIFGGGASPQFEYNTPYTGFHLIENPDYSGNNGMYRWYILDGIRFKKRIRWTIEHGHANNFENDYSSVAYWYQKEPHKKFPNMLKLEDRIPRFPENYRKIWRKLLFTTVRVALKQDKLDSKEFQNALHDFMRGDYQKAYKYLKNIKSLIKNEN